MSSPGKNHFLNLAHVIRQRLEKPRLNAWWLDICDLTAELESQRRELMLPHWLESFDDSIDSMMTTDEANQVRSNLVRFWKPGEKFDPDCFRIFMFGDDRIRFAFCDPFRSMSFVGYETNFFGFAEKTGAIDSFHARPFDQSESPFDNVRLDAIFCIDAWIRYVETGHDECASDEEFVEVLRSRFAAFRESFWSLTAVIYGLQENPPRLIMQELCAINDQHRGGLSLDYEDEIRFAAAWQEVSARLDRPLTDASRYGRQATSFHALISDVTFELTRGFVHNVGGIWYRPPLDHDLVEWIYSQPQMQSGMISEARRCRGWDSNYLHRMLILEAGWMQRLEASEIGRSLSSEAKANTVRGGEMLASDSHPDDAVPIQHGNANRLASAVNADASPNTDVPLWSGYHAPGLWQEAFNLEAVKWRAALRTDWIPSEVAKRDPLTPKRGPVRFLKSFLDERGVIEPRNDI